eukprot:g2263.t1
MEQNQEDFASKLREEVIEFKTALLRQKTRTTSELNELAEQVAEIKNLLRRTGVEMYFQKNGNAVFDEDKDETQAVGTVLITLFFVYLYAVSLSLPSLLFFAYLLNAKLTDWSGAKYDVPVVDLDVFFLQFCFPAFAIPAAIMGTFQIACHWESGIKENPDCKLFPYGLLEGIGYLISCSFGIGVMHLLWYYGKFDSIFWGRLDYFIISMSTVFGMILGGKLRDIAFHWLEGKRFEDLIKEKMKQRKRKRSSIGNVSATIAEEAEREGSSKWIFVLSIFICVLYPIILMKAYNSDSIHDVWRICFVCLVHPAISESILLSLRNAKNDVKSLQFSKKLYLQNQAEVFFLEGFLQFSRRIMIGCMHHHSSVYIALALMSLEEGIMRSTFLERDAWFRRKRKLPPITESESPLYRQTIAIYLVNQMLVEVICIIISKAFVILTRPHRYIFNIGFQAEGIGNDYLIAQLCLELALEFAVDGFAMYKEIFNQNLRLEKYFSFLTKEIFVAYMGYVNIAISSVLMCFISTPDVYFCENADPCTCSGGSFRLYISTCAFRNAPIETQELYYNGTVTLDLLPRQFITQMSNASNSSNASYVLDMKKMSNVYKSAFDSIPPKIQSAMAYGTIACPLIILGMLIANRALRAYGFTEEVVKNKVKTNLVKAAIKTRQTFQEFKTIKHKMSTRRSRNEKIQRRSVSFESGMTKIRPRPTSNGKIKPISFDDDGKTKRKAIKENS